MDGWGSSCSWCAMCAVCCEILERGAFGWDVDESWTDDLMDGMGRTVWGRGGEKRCDRGEANTYMHAPFVSMYELTKSKIRWRHRRLRLL